MGILKWILIGLLGFVFFAAVSMGIMIYMAPKKSPQTIDKQEVTSVKKVKTTDTNSTQEITIEKKTKPKREKSSGNSNNSPAKELKAIKAKYKQLEIKYDSLNTAAVNHLAALEVKDAEIKKLTSSLTGKADRAARAKDLAKTLSSMKVTKIAPILSKLDDQSVIEIYRQMGKAERKNILLGLSGDRAAAIAKKLIN